MIIAINLINKVFILMIICFCVFELITMGAFILLSQIPLQRNIGNIELVSLDNAKEIATSFSQLLIGTFANIRTDMLLFVKHTRLYFQDLGLPHLDSKSLFSSSYSTCLYHDKKQFDPSFTSYERILSRIDFAKAKREVIIDDLLRNTNLSVGYYYSDASTDVALNEPFICYALSFLKTLLIRNTIMAQRNQIMLNFTMLIGDALVFYPASKLNFSQVKMLPHYNTADTSCNVKYHFNCLNSTYLNEVFQENEFYSFSPIQRNQSIITNFCIKFKEPDENNLLCTTLNISQIISNITIPSDNVILNLVKENNTNGIELLYSSALDMKTAFELFDKEIFGIHRLSKSKDKLTLFHSLYYKLVKIANLSDESIQDIVNEYANNLKAVNDVMKDYIRDSQLKASHNLRIIQTSLQYSTVNNSETIKSYSYQPDLYNYYITRIVAKNTKYNESTYVFDTKSESNYLYLVIALKIGNSVYSNKVYTILAFRSIKSLIYTLSEILVGCILVYVLFQNMVAVLLYPLNLFKSVICSIVDRKKEIERAKAGILINEERQKVVFDEATIKDEYTSREIQSIGRLIIFLNQIINLKDSKTSNNKRAKLYSNISEYIEKHKLEKIKSKIIVAKYYLKETASDSVISETDNERDYQKAIDILEDIQKSLEEKENDIISQNDDIAQRCNSLSQMKGIYINEYNYEKLLPNEPYITLQFIKQNYNFVLGLAYYYSFNEIYKGDKGKEEINKNYYSDKHSNEKALFLSQAIDNFKKASRINDHLQVNSIKNIIIYLYLSKCYYYYQNENQKTESAKMLKKSIVSYAKFFKMIKELTEETKTPKFFVDPRIVLMISGILMEDILYSIGHFAKKLNKHQTAFVFLTKIFSVSYYKNHHIHQKAIHVLEKVLRVSKTKKNNTYRKLYKLEMRLALMPKKKVVFIIISEHLTENYHSLESFRLLIKNCLMKYLNDNDLVGYIYLYKVSKIKKLDLKGNSEKGYNVLLLEKRDAVREIDNHLSQLSSNSRRATRNSTSCHHSRIYLGDSFETISRICLEKQLTNIDLYCFAFAKVKDICFSSNDKAKRLFEELYHKDASIYVYCFDKQLPTDKSEHYRKFFSFFSEGVIALVRNFKIIKLGFENIANLPKQSNVLSIDYSSTDNVFIN